MTHRKQGIIMLQFILNGIYSEFLKTAFPGLVSEESK